MDRVIFEEGGFGLTTKTFEFLQSAPSDAISAIGKTFGNHAIIEGVERNGSNVSGGTIFVNGEYLPFAAGPYNTKVSIYEIREPAKYNLDIDIDGVLDDKDAYVKRYAKCGADGMESFDFSRLKPYYFNFLSFLRKVPLPFSGSINSVPKGFQLCDGTNGTPDLRGMFLAGYDPSDIRQNQIGERWGRKQVTLTVNELPSHNHTGSTGGGGGHRHGYKDAFFAEAHAINPPYKLEGPRNHPGSNEGRDFDNYAYYKDRTTNYEQNHTHSFTTNNRGGNRAFDIRPPYYTVAYIMFVG
ncbi:hypothetical protein U6A24_13625 [Aquimarina gracilis]|uniref:Microcystin-dependent protein n=1 Tax=Aquimarina gracilis TaxID=874422 RepID=A0ABU5ZXC5_9FLAO|nr:hypothetical protein [Aquimarina gracilis]MEB3346512.1 hypothetical protein [Aquimarina gracilis]